MSTGLLFGLPRNQLEAFDEAVEAARAEVAASAGDAQAKARLAQTLAGLIRSSIDIPRVLKELCDTTFGLMTARLIDNYHDVGGQLDEAFADAERILNSVQDLVDAFERVGGSVRNSEQLKAALRAACDQRNSILQHWPDFSANDVEEARAADKRGEMLELTEAFARVAGMDKEAWLRLVETRKSARAS
jgi:hypothetical protein